MTKITNVQKVTKNYKYIYNGGLAFFQFKQSILYQSLLYYLAQPKKYTFQNIQTKDASESSNTISSKPCIISNFMAEIEQEEHSNTSISENIDDDNNEFYTNLISVINERNPL